MPRPKPEKTVIPSTALVASASRYTGTKPPRIYQRRADWQAECYRHYSICGEARFAAKFFGHAVSRAVLKPGVIKDGIVTETDDPAINAQLGALFNGSNGQRQMLESIGIHLTIAGECYLIGRSDAGEEEGVTAGQDIWEIVSVLEISVTGTTWTIKYSDGRPPIELTDNDVVIRIWLPNPAMQIEADSPFRSLLPILSEIEWLTKHVFAQITSRLAGAGILLMPQEMTFPTGDGGAATANEAESFMVALGEAMMDPIEDASSPNAVIPYVVTAPGDSIDKARLLTFWSELDENSLALRSEAIRRFALGMDLPPEQVLGMSSNRGSGGGTSNGVSHWGAWQIEEATVKLHIEPMLDVIVNGLTIGYLRPLGDPLAAIIYDTSGLRLRPDRSKEAFELYDRGLLSSAALFRENGFEVEDQPEEAEFQRWLLVKMATGSATPEQVQAAMKALGVTLDVVVSGTPGAEAPPPPSLEEHPGRPRTPDESSLLAASEALVFRALERAGNRLRQIGKPVGVPAYETHLFVSGTGQGNLLDDAWSTAPMVLAGIADPDEVVPVLNSYCQSLLSGQAPHKRETLRTWLAQVGR